MLAITALAYLSCNYKRPNVSSGYGSPSSGHNAGIVASVISPLT